MDKISLRSILPTPLTRIQISDRALALRNVVYGLAALFFLAFSAYVLSKLLLNKSSCPPAQPENPSEKEPSPIDDKPIQCLREIFRIPKANSFIGAECKEALGLLNSQPGDLIERLDAIFTRIEDRIRDGNKRSGLNIQAGQNDEFINPEDLKRLFDELRVWQMNKFNQEAERIEKNLNAAITELSNLKHSNCNNKFQLQVNWFNKNFAGEAYTEKRNAINILYQQYTDKLESMRSELKPFMGK